MNQEMTIYQIDTRGQIVSVPEKSFRKPLLVLVGPTPPPVHGVTVSTVRLLQSGIHREFKVFHLDTSDHRSVSTIGALDLTNIALALKSYAQLICCCIRHRPDIVYVPISQTFVGLARDAFYLILPKVFSAARIVVHLRGGYFGSFYEKGGPAVKLLVDLAMRFVDRVIVLGECFRSIFTRWVKEDCIDVVPNGTDFINETNYSKTIKTEGFPIVTFMSSLIRSKGIVDFIRAAISVSKLEPTTKFIVAGEWWPQESALKGEVESILAAAPDTVNITFCGLVGGEEKKALLKRTDIFVLPTYYPFEGHPNAIVEAMAAGCPVISTNHAAIPETVMDGESGLIVEARNPAMLASAILRLLRSDDLLQKMSINSFARYKECYTAARSNQLLITALRRSFDLSVVSGVETKGPSYGRKTE